MKLMLIALFCLGLSGLVPTALYADSHRCRVQKCTENGKRLDCSQTESRPGANWKACYRYAMEKSESEDLFETFYRWFFQAGKSTQKMWKGQVNGISPDRARPGDARGTLDPD